MMNNILADLDDFLAPSQECIKMVPPPNARIPAKLGGGQGDADCGTGNAKALVQIGNAFDDVDFEMKVEINQKQ